MACTSPASAGSSAAVRQIYASARTGTGPRPPCAEPWIPVPHSARIEQVPLLVRLALLVLQDESPAGGEALRRWVVQHSGRVNNSLILKAVAVVILAKCHRSLIQRVTQNNEKRAQERERGSTTVIHFS